MDKKNKSTSLLEKVIIKLLRCQQCRKENILSFLFTKVTVFTTLLIKTAIYVIHMKCFENKTEIMFSDYTVTDHWKSLSKFSKFNV